MTTIASYAASFVLAMGTLSAAFMNDAERKRFYQDILNAHNRFRFWHHADQLKLDEELCDLLKVHTDMVEANEPTQIPTSYGINVFTVQFKYKPLLIADWIVSMWYSKALVYDYSAEPSSTSKEIDAFTQVVWKDTKYIGVGMWIKNKTCCVVVVYSPQGNKKGQYLTNVQYPYSLFKPNI